MNFDDARSHQQMLEEAAEWLVYQREGMIDAGGQQTFTAWLRRSPEHIKAYLEAAAVWADVGSLASKEDVDVAELIAFGRSDGNVIPLGAGSSGISISEARADPRAVLRNTDRPEIPMIPRVPRPRLGRWPVIAACLALVGIGVVAAIWHEVYQGLYSTSIGEQRSIALADGSTIALNARSAVRVRYDGKLRSVELLSGQCLFKVAPNANRPFVVTSGDLQVRAVGTQFDIDLKHSGATVTVVEGAVTVSPLDRGAGSIRRQTLLTSGGGQGAPISEGSASDVLVGVGEQIVVQPKAYVSASQLRPADTKSVTAWTQRQAVFEGAPLSDVVDEFNRYNPRQMTITDPRIETLRVSGVFSLVEQGLLLRFLRQQAAIEVIEDSDSIRIAKK